MDNKTDDNGKNINRKWLMMGAALIIGVVLMLEAFSIGKEQNVIPEHNANNLSASEPVTVSSEVARLEQATERRLEEVLGEIQGAGKVSVTLFLAAGPQYNYANNTNTSNRTVEEQDQGGGARVTTEINEDSQMVMSRAAGSNGDRPVVIKEIKPDVRGVLVVAEGASDPFVRATLTKAVQTLMGIPAHQVNVLPRK